MIYIPSEYYNTYYTYGYNNNVITIKTNNNCYTQYTTTYCDCINIYTKEDYSHSNTYSCSLNTNNIIDISSLTTDIYYRNDITNVFIIVFIISFVMVWVLTRIFGKFFKWLK